MTNTNDFNIDEQTISELGLRLSGKDINAQIAPNARVFEYPGLDNVFIMESDLYGNTMPEGSCFLAFSGHRGLIGRNLKIDTLKTDSPEEIKAMIESHSEA
jgi:hypothetical protein